MCRRFGLWWKTPEIWKIARQALDQQVSWRSPAQVRVCMLADGYQLALDDGSGRWCAATAIMAKVATPGLREQLGGSNIKHRPTGKCADRNISPRDAHSLAFRRFTEEDRWPSLPLAVNRYALVDRVSLETERLMALDDAVAFLARLRLAFGYRLGSLRQVEHAVSLSSAN
jgi:2-octaprenyl-6-methoxyphenol hydroxylase